MGKFLLILSIFCLMILGIGTAKAPSDAMFWLASGALLYQKVRGILILLLLLQFITNPPRQSWVRLITGMTGLVIGIWTIQATASFAMPALDTLAFLSASIALLVTAIERKVVINPSKSVYSIKSLQGHLSA